MNRGDLIPRKTDTNVLEGSLWMVGISLALFFLPVLNGLIGGLVGGYKVGTPKRALSAAVLPAIIVALGLWLLLIILDLPFIGLLAGLTMGLLILFADIGIFIGALIGGAMRSRRGPTLSA